MTVSHGQQCHWESEQQQCSRLIQLSATRACLRNVLLPSKSRSSGEMPHPLSRTSTPPRPQSISRTSMGQAQTTGKTKQEQVPNCAPGTRRKVKENANAPQQSFRVRLSPGGEKSSVFPQFVHSLATNPQWMTDVPTYCGCACI